MITTLKKFVPVLLNRSEEKYILAIDILDLHFRISHRNIPMHVIEKYMNVDLGTCEYVIENFSGEELNNLLLVSYIYWVNCYDTVDQEKFIGPDWDSQINHHKNHGAPTDIIKYCCYGKELLRVAENISTNDMYEILLTLINSFVKEEDCLIRSKLIMAYMLTKYGLWECDFCLTYRDSRLSAYDDDGICINLTYDMLNDMSKVFNICAYDKYDNKLILAGRH